jgi:hypothetical protein
MQLTNNAAHAALLCLNGKGGNQEKQQASRQEIAPDTGHEPTPQKERGLVLGN